MTRQYARLVKAPPQDEQPDSPLDAVVDHLTDFESVQYIRSRDIAPELDLGSVQVGQLLADLADQDDAPVAVEGWSTSRKGSTVWKVDAVEDGDRR